MIKNIFVRPVRPSDTKDFFEWSKNQPGFDPEIPAHPGTMVLAAYNKEKITSYIPVQTPFVIETLAPNPEATDFEIASSLREFTQFLVSQAYLKNIAEIYFLSTDDGTSEFASNHVYEKLPYTVYRCRISDLEPNPPIVKE